MQHPGFFERAGPFPLRDVAAVVGAEPAAGADLDRLISDVRPIAEAGQSDVAFIDNRKFLAALPTTRAAACFIAPAFVDRVPAGTVALSTRSPYRAFALALAKFYPTAMRPQVAVADAGSLIDPTARIEPDVEIEPGAIIGREASIGSGTRIAAGAVIGYRVAIGRDCYIGAQSTLTHALVGNRVIIHSGVRIGQDGFGFAMGPAGHLKVPQIGRVIIQDDVEIGANSCVDRGALKDTIIGEGSKIDNLVQIGHNVVLGRHCVIVAQVGISGSTELGEFVIVGGQAGISGHLKIGDRAQVAGACHPTSDVAAGARMGGTPARPFRQWARESVLLTRMATASKDIDDRAGKGGDDEVDGA